LEQEILQIVTSLITPHALFPPTFVLIWPNWKWRCSIRLPQKPYSVTKHEVVWIACCGDMAIQVFEDGSRAAILDLVKPEIAPFDLPTFNTLP